MVVQTLNPDLETSEPSFDELKVNKTQRYFCEEII